MDHEIFIGIDVGGARKGFHMVALGAEMRVQHISHAPTVEAVVAVLRAWRQASIVPVVAIDSPCAWSADGGSRQAERDLELGDRRIHCFCTPTRERAEEHLGRARANGRNDFYGWVRNGMNLFDALAEDWPLFRGTRQQQMAIETFPQAVSCHLQGAVVRRDRNNRLQLVKNLTTGAEQLGGDPDFIDAALCAIAALSFRVEADASGPTFHQFGRPEEGFIVVPRPNWRA